MAKKPIIVSGSLRNPTYLWGPGGKNRLFTAKGIRRYADKEARQSGLQGAYGHVSDLGDCWRVTVMAQREDWNNG